MPGRSDNYYESAYSNGHGNSNQTHGMDPTDIPKGLTRKNSRLWLNREHSRLYLHREASRLYLNRENSKMGSLGPLNRENSRINVLKREDSKLNLGLNRENTRFNLQQPTRHERKRAKKQPSRDVEQFMQVLRDRQGGIHRETTDLRLRKRQPLPGIGESPRDRGLDAYDASKNYDDKRIEEIRAPSPESDVEIDLPHYSRDVGLVRKTPSPDFSPKISRKFPKDMSDSPKFPRRFENSDSPSISRKFGPQSFRDSPSLSRKFNGVRDQTDSPIVTRRQGPNTNVSDQSPGMARKFGPNSNNRMNISHRTSKMVNTGNKLVPLQRRVTAGHHLPPLAHEELLYPDRPDCPQPSRTPPHPDSQHDCFDNPEIEEEPVDFMDLE